MLFHYQRSRRQTARLIALNMLVLLVFYGLFHHLAEAEPQHQQLRDIALYGLIAVELILATALAWMLARPAVFEIRVSDQEFTIVHPTSRLWSFSVNPQDILRLEQTMEILTTDHHQLARRLVLRNGQTFEICRNYPYSVRALYDALKKANPAIELPSNPYYFKKRR